MHPVGDRRPARGLRAHDHRMRRDPFESTLMSTLLIGGPLTLVALVKLVIFAVAGRAEARSALVFVFLLGFAVVLGPVVATTRKWLGPERSLRSKNLATGVLVGAGYAVGCTLVFGGGMDLEGKL